jgi:hypothetical protein
MPLDRNSIDEPYEMQVARQRCGDKIADALMPSTVLVDMLTLMAELEGRVEAISARQDELDEARRAENRSERAVAAGERA